MVDLDGGYDHGRLYELWSDFYVHFRLHRVIVHLLVLKVTCEQCYRIFDFDTGMFVNLYAISSRRIDEFDTLMAANFVLP